MSMSDLDADNAVWMANEMISQIILILEQARRLVYPEPSFEQSLTKRVEVEIEGERPVEKLTSFERVKEEEKQ